jgi:hypothetical protein
VIIAWSFRYLSLTPRTPAVRGVIQTSGWPALGRDAPETVVFNHPRRSAARIK